MTVLTFGFKAKDFENLNLRMEPFWRELRTRATFDRCVEQRRESVSFPSEARFLGGGSHTIARLPSNNTRPASRPAGAETEVNGAQKHKSKFKVK